MPARISMNLNLKNPTYSPFQKPLQKIYTGPSIRMNLSSPMVSRIAGAKVGCNSCGK